MIYIGYFIFAFGLIRLIVSFVNWITFPYLPEQPNEVDAPLVSILIPARNEQENIGNLLNDLVCNKYKPLEIIVYDDNSTDKTCEIVNKFSSTYNHIKLIKGDSLPEGWLGKNFACYKLASYAKGKKLLFLDADVRINDEVISKSLVFMNQHKLRLLSIFPTQIMPSIGSYLSVPLMNWILLSLLPLVLIRLSNWPSLSAANGQFLFFDSHVYCQVQPHLQYKNNKVEDIAIIKEYKRRKIKVATLLGGKDVYCRMYTSLSEGVNGFSKNIFQFFGGNSFTAILFALVTTIAPLFLFTFNGSAIGILYVLMILSNRILVSISSMQSFFKNLILIVPQQVVFWVIIISALIKYKHKNIVWKDRNISSAS